MNQSPSGRSLRCGNCGKAFSLPELTPEVACPYCGQVHLAAELVSELDTYAREVDVRLGAADQHYERVAAWERLGNRSSTQNLLVAQGLMVGLPLVLAGFGFLLFKVGLIGEEDPGVGMGAFAASYVGLAVYLVWHALGRKQVEAQKATPGETRVACPSCGAPGTLTPGAGIDLCSYCGAALIPSKTTIRHGIDAAEQAALQAKMARYRTERRGMVRIGSVNESPIGRFMVLGMVGGPLLMLGATVVGFSWQMATGSEEFSPAIFVLWAMLIAVGGPGALYFYRRSENRKAWRAAIDALALQFGGRVSTTLSGWVEWLNTYWTGPFKVNIQRSYGPAAALDASGYPALVLADLPDAVMSSEKPKIELMLAAWVPGHCDARPKIRPDERGAAARKRLMERYQITVNEAGLHLRGKPGELARLYAHPAAAQGLAPVLSDLATLAASLGAEPMEPIPEGR